MNDHNNEQYEEEVKAPRKRFNIFDHFYNTDKHDAGSDLHVIEKPNLPNFFKLLGRNFSRIFTINLLMVATNFPLFFLALGLSGYVSSTSVAPCYAAYSSLRCVSYFDHSPAAGALLSTYGATTAITVPTVWTYICYGLTALVFLTFGASCVGSAYLFRSMVRGEPIFLWSDYRYAIRKNWKQALPFGAFDLFVIVMLIVDIYYYNITYSSSTMMSVMLFLSWAMAIFYFMARMYIYPMIITFDLSIWKVLKNAISFVILGIKRNILVLCGVIVLLAFEILLAALPVTAAIAVILPLVYLISLVGLMNMYAAYPKIKEIMIDPYYAEHPNERPENA